jgi:hypothetical protein
MEVDDKRKEHKNERNRISVNAKICPRQHLRHFDVFGVSDHKNNSDYDLLSYYTIQDDEFVPVLRNNALPLSSA